MIWRIAYGGACALLLAAITHIAIVLLIPVFGTRDAFALLSQRTELLTFTSLGSGGVGNLPLIDIDPFFAYGVCRFDLSQSGVSLRSEESASFWSATVLDDDGAVVYSLNSRTAIDGRLDLILLDPLDILRLREYQPPESETAVIVETEMSEGLIVLRVLRPDETWRDHAARFLDTVTCESYSPAPAAISEVLEPDPDPAAPGAR